MYPPCTLRFLRSGGRRLARTRETLKKEFASRKYWGLPNKRRSLLEILEYQFCTLRFLRGERHLTERT